MGQVRVGVFKLVDTLCERQHALFAVGGLQRSKLDAAEEEAFHVEVVVLVYFLGNDLAHCLSHFLVADVEVVLAQSLLNLALSDLMLMVMTVVMMLVMFHSVS